MQKGTFWKLKSRLLQHTESQCVAKGGSSRLSGSLMSACLSVYFEIFVKSLTH